MQHLSSMSPNKTPKQSRKDRIWFTKIRCMHCGCKYTPEPKQHGYPDEMRKQAVQMYVDGMNLRRIARHFGIHHRTVSLWVKASAASSA